MAAANKAAGKQAITLHDHIKELRNRLFVVAIVFVVTSAVAYNYKDALLYYLLKPLNGEKLVYLNPAGGFSFIFQVTMYVGIAIAIPFLIYNIYKFVAPALPERARKHSAAVMISSLVLLCAGVAFGYIFAIPGALNFLNNFGDGYITPNLTADSYLNFILAYTAGLGILFQLPLVLLLIHWIHPLKPLGLFKFERYMILLAFIGAAMITPTPDVMNQTIMAAPIILMYQVGVIAVCVSVAKAKRRARLATVPSRSDKKAQKKATKLAKKGKGKTKREEKPAGGTILAMPAIPVSLETTPETAVVPEVASAVGPAPVRRGRMMDIAGPVRSAKPKVAAATPAPSPVQAIAPAKSQPSLSMDIMMPHATPSTIRGGIPHSDRPVHHRTPTLQVPQRSRMVPSIDGVFVQ